MANPQRANWGAFNNPQFNRLQTEIEQQTQALLRQRESLTNNQTNSFLVEQPYLRPVESQRYIKLNSDRNHSQQQTSRNPVTDKVKELVELCKKQNTAFGNQLIRVLSDQKNIYNELVSNGQSSQKTQYFGVNNPIMEEKKESSVYNGSRQREPSYGSSGSHSLLKVSVPTKSNIQSAIETNTKLQLGDDLIQMIEEIERKALNEIQKLREEKIDLMKQLKQQIQSNNELQKQINNFNFSQMRSQQSIIQNSTPSQQYQQEDQSEKIPLQQEILRQIRFQMNNLRRQNQSLRDLSHRYQPVNGQHSLNQNQVNKLMQRFAVLEGQLRNRDQMIRRLSNEVNRLNQHDGTTPNPQLSSLLQQGESIRQNTLYLIRLKQGQANSQAFMNGKSSFNEQERIRQLQELLQRQEEEKQIFLNDLLVFKQKYQQLEQENRQLKRLPKLGSSDVAKFSPITEKSQLGQSYGNSLDDYERHLSQMRGVYRI